MRLFWFQDNNINGEDDDNSGIGSGDDSGSESDDSSGSESDSEDNGSTSMTVMNRIGVIVHAVIQLAGKVSAQGRMYLKSGLMEAEASRTELTTTKSINVSTHVLSGDGDVKKTSTAEAGINEGGGSTREEKMEADTSAGDDGSFRFPQFEIVQQSPTDHHYLDSMKQVRNFFFSGWFLTECITNAVMLVQAVRSIHHQKQT